MTFDTKGGAELRLIVLLDGVAGAGAMGLPNGVGLGSAVANASDTANTYITVLTPGVSYTSASGVSYVAPVPEPRSFWLLAAALVTIGIGARRRLASRG